MLASRLKDLLDNRHIDYVIIEHAKTYTAQETAASAHIPGKELAKTVMVKLDGKLAMTVLPAASKINLGRFKKACGARMVQLASEEDFRDLFPEYEIGAMPPFGNLFDMDVYIEESLADDENIVFNAGTHTELMKLAYKDFDDVVHPKVANFIKLH